MSSKQVAFRGDDALIGRLDRLVGLLRKDPAYAGLEISRSTVVRLLIQRGLGSLEVQLGLPVEGPKDLELTTREWWRKREAEAENELQAIRLFLEAWEAMYADKKFTPTNNSGEPES